MTAVAYLAKACLFSGCPSIARVSAAKIGKDILAIELLPFGKYPHNSFYCHLIYHTQHHTLLSTERASILSCLDFQNSHQSIMYRRRERHEKSCGEFRASIDGSVVDRRRGCC